MLSCCTTESVNPPLEIWMKRQKGLLDVITLQYDPKRAVLWQLRGNGDTLNIFQALFFHLLKNKKAWQRETCFGLDHHFLWVFVGQKCPVPFPLCEKHKRGHCQTESWCTASLRHNKDFSVFTTSSLLLNLIDSVCSEWQSGNIQLNRWGLSLRRMKPFVIGLPALFGP